MLHFSPKLVARPKVLNCTQITMRITLIVKRLFRLFPVMLGVLLIVFSLMHLAPGDPVELMMGEAGHVTEEEIQQLKAQYGLDKPLYVQLIKYIANASVGHLGVSFGSSPTFSSIRTMPS